MDVKRKRKSTQLGQTKAMPPNIDIYSMTRHRDAATINRFIDNYVDRLKSEDRGDEEIMLVPLAGLPVPLSLQSFDWEPALTLTHIIERGLDYPRRAFTVYLSSKREDIHSIILGFTTDNQLVLGLSIDDESEKAENEVIAKILLEKLMTEFDCHAGIIRAETPPPTSEIELLKLQEDPFTLFSVH